MNVIFTNDDGIDAAGLRALVDHLPEWVNASVVAPSGERSASSHSISLGQKLYVDIWEKNHVTFYSVNGTPADCIKFAVSELKEIKPDLVVSGINQGANTGVSVYYSGTISAAREGLINRIPAMAVSLCSAEFRDFRAGVDVTQRLMEAFRQHALPPQALLNVNLPPLPPDQISGLKVTRQAPSRFVEEFAVEKDSKGRKVYTLVGEIELLDEDGSSDEEAVASGYISLTPLRLDMTDYPSMKEFEEWLKHQ